MGLKLHLKQNSVGIKKIMDYNLYFFPVATWTAERRSRESREKSPKSAASWSEATNEASKPPLDLESIRLAAHAVIIGAGMFISW